MTETHESLSREERNNVNEALNLCIYTFSSGEVECETIMI